MHMLNIAGYKFITLDNLKQLRQSLYEQCQALALKGTILLSIEGININLSGTQESITTFKENLKLDARFKDIHFQESLTEFLIFKRLKIKLKKEIITLRKKGINPAHTRAKTLAPIQLKQWLDEKRDVMLLDTRNEYETRFGTFMGAVSLSIDHFCQFPAAVDALPKEKPIVMFCTGGIRCEKAALYMMNKGYSEVYQLEGGILQYFATVGSTHYQGECFVFDERVSVDNNLKNTGTFQCKTCQGPIFKNKNQSSIFASYCDNCRA